MNSISKNTILKKEKCWLNAETAVLNTLVIAIHFSFDSHVRKSRSDTEIVLSLCVYPATDCLQFNVFPHCVSYSDLKNK